MAEKNGLKRVRIVNRVQQDTDKTKLFVMSSVLTFDGDGKLIDVNQHLQENLEMSDQPRSDDV